MGKHLNANIKLEVLNKYINGYGSLNTLSKEFDIPRSTIYKWIKETRDGKDITVRKKGSGRSKNENIDYKERYEILKKYQAFLKAQREKK